jgi:hypothetical protein
MTEKQCMKIFSGKDKVQWRALVNTHNFFGFYKSGEFVDQPSNY